MIDPLAISRSLGQGGQPAGSSGGFGDAFGRAFGSQPTGQPAAAQSLQPRSAQAVPATAQMMPPAQSPQPAQAVPTFSPGSIPGAPDASAMKQWGVDPRGNNPYMDYLRNFAGAMYPGAASNAGFASSLAPGWQNSILHAISQLDPSNIQGQIGQFNNQAMEQGAGAGSAAANQMAARGFGSGAQGGAIQNSMQGAQAAMNANYQHQMDPMQVLQRYMAQLGLYGQGMQNPMLQQFEGFNQAGQNAYSQNMQSAAANNAMQQFMQAIGQVAPMFGPTGMAVGGVARAAGTGATPSGWGGNGASTTGSGMPWGVQPSDWSQAFSFPMTGG